MFPANGSVTRPTPFPTHRLPPGEVSLLSSGTMKGLRLPASIPSAPLPSRPVPLPAFWYFALVDARSPVYEPGTCQAGWSLPAIEERRSAGSPKFLGNPHVHLPCSRTPAGPFSPSHYGESMLPPRTRRRRLLRPQVLSRLSHTAFALAVYASCRHD